MKEIAKLLEDLEQLKIKKESAPLPPPDSYRSYIDAFKGYDKTYDSISRVLETTLLFDGEKYGKRPSAKTLKSTLSCGPGRSMSVELSTNPYNREAVVVFRDGDRHNSTNPIEMPKLVEQDEAFFFAFVRDLVHVGFATDWVLGGIRQLFDNLLTAAHEERENAEKELDEVLTEKDIPVKGTFRHKVYALWQSETDDKEKKVREFSDKLDNWIHAFWERNAEEITQTATLLRKTREVLGHYPPSLTSIWLFDESDEKVCVSGNNGWGDGYYYLSLKMGEASKSQDCSEEPKSAYSPRCICMECSTSGAWTKHLDFYVDDSAKTLNQKDAFRTFASQTINHIGKYIGRLPYMEAQLMKKMRDIREVIRVEVVKELKKEN